MKNSNEINLINFKDQEFFIGIDVHNKNWKVTIRCNHMELKTFSQDPSPEELSRYMNKNYPHGVYNSVYEAGFCGYWIHRGLEKLGFKNIIVNPADVPTTNKEKDQKRDPIDSRKLARELENSSLKGIYIPTEEQQSLRSISRIYYQTIRKRIQIKNRIKGFLHFHGIVIPSHQSVVYWTGSFMHWLKNISFKESDDRYYLDCQLNYLAYYRKQTKDILTRIREYSKNHSIIQYIKSIPGIGLIIAFTLYAEIMDMRRFKNLDRLASMIGLVPSVHCSGDNEIMKGITFRYSKYVRQLLIEAAWIAIKKDPALTQSYSEYIKRMKKQKAIIKIAKKLLNRVRYVWLNQREYVLSVVK
jgi:transposase